MRNQKNLLTLLVFLVLLSATGCRHTPADVGNIEQGMMQDPDSCLHYYHRQYTTMVRQKNYGEMERLYARILRAMPPHPRQSKDLNYHTGWILSLYYNMLVYQEKLEGSERLTDSLLNSSHPYYSHNMRPELLSTSALFYLAQNRIDEVDSLGRLFLTLPPTDDPRRDSRNCYKMVWALEFGEIESDTLLHLMEHSLECTRKVVAAEEETGEEAQIYSYMGYLYWKEGSLEKAVLHIQEALDWYDAHPTVSRQGMIEAYVNLSRVYISLRLFDKCIEASQRAVEVSQSLDNWTLEEVYRMRAVCFERADQPDSALFYVQKAIEATPPALSYYLPTMYANRMAYQNNARPDSMSWQLDECRRLLKDTAAIDTEARNNLYVFYGTNLLRVPGCEKEAVEYMERGLHNFIEFDYPEGILYASNELIKGYLQTGHTDRIPDVFALYTATNDSLQRENNANAAIGANIRYETGRKEQENLALSAELELKQRTITFVWTLVAMLGLLLVGGGWHWRQRQRYLRRVSDARLSQISGLLRAQQELSHHNASLAQELHDTSHELEKTSGELEKTSGELEKTSGELSKVSSRLDAVSRQKTVSDIRVKISTELFNFDKEVEFRRNFTSVYPDYLPALHQLSGDLTSTDELIAMLLLLELSNSEIALTLGISKNGVNKARSRMRQRLGLKSEIILEEFLKEVLKK